MEKVTDYEPLEFHYATDRRVYHGCECSDLRRERESIEAAVKRVKEFIPNLSVTHFPMGGFYQAFDRYKILTLECGSRQDCLREVWRKIHEEQYRGTGD